MQTQFRRVLSVAALCIAALASARVGLAQEKKSDAKSDPPKPASFYRQVRPILQRHCVGCHQPAKRGGKLLLTTFEGFRNGGENGKGFTPGKPGESLIIDYISGEKPEMPRDGDPLKKEQVALIARWIKQGAKDDTPEAAKDTISASNPPKYVRPPVVTALAYSPDSTLLAVSGFHETLLHKADGSGMVGRLVGTAQRIESIAFSPDGKLLAAAGGNPSLFGEVQLWDVEKRNLAGSGTFTFDVCYGVSFSPDGKQIAFGAADNRARVATVPELKPVMRFDAHTGYVQGTTFSLKGDHVISVSRDQSMKLVIVKNAQLVDNITSITPGGLKGPLVAVQRHPLKEQVLVAGDEGRPKLFKIFRTRKRIIGDDFNHIRDYDPLPGRIVSVQFNKDGSRFVVGSSTAKDGVARIYTTGVYDEKTTNNAGGLGQTFQAIAARSKEKALVHELKGTGPVFAVAYRPDGRQVAVGGFDGKVRLFDAATGKLVKEFVPVTISNTTASR